MNIIICVDDNNGTFFNHRRQSRDQILQERILQLCGDHRLLMSQYSAKLFGTDEHPQIIVDDNFLEIATVEDFCFVEGIDLAPIESSIDKIILCKWNREYPADRFFDIPLSEHGWQLISAEELIGKSHEKINLEVYTR